MAGDWIKMRHNLETDPDVLRIAEHVGVDRFSVVGRLHMIWSWADQHSVDGCAISATTSFLDELVCCANFCEALRKVGWLAGRDWDLRFPNFDRHNGETAKKRASAQKTMQKKRSASATNVAQDAQPEKRREEKSLTPSLSRDQLNEMEPHEAWASEWETWVASWDGRMGRRLDPVQAQIQLGELLAADPQKAKRDLAFSLKKYAKSILDSDDDYSKRSRSSSGQKKSELRI